MSSPGALGVGRSYSGALVALAMGATLGAAACNSDDDGPTDASTTEVNDGTVSDADSSDTGAEHQEPSPPDADAESCASPPTGEWAGQASILLAGSGSSYTVRADVRWQLASSVGCVDRYQPTGTAFYTFSGPCGLTVEPGSAPIDPGDGELVIDRTVSPPTYRMTGDTRWDAISTCAGEEPGTPNPVGGSWADNHGAFDGAVISGGVDNYPEVIAWRFTRVDVAFPSPGSGCSEPSTDRWAGTASVAFGASVSVIWTRVATNGCVDHYEPTGIASAPPAFPPCASWAYQPATHEVIVYDGVLEINRSTDPATFRMTGTTTWDGIETCIREGDGEVQVFEGLVGGNWAFFNGAFDGDRWSGGTGSASSHEYEWSLTRLP